MQMAFPGRAGKEGKKQGKPELILTGAFFFLSVISHYWRKWIGFLPSFIKFLWFSNLEDFHFQWKEGDWCISQKQDLSYLLIVILGMIPY